MSQHTGSLIFYFYSHKNSLNLLGENVLMSHIGRCAELGYLSVIIIIDLIIIIMMNDDDFNNTKLRIGNGAKIRYR